VPFFVRRFSRITTSRLSRQAFAAFSAHFNLCMACCRFIESWKKFTSPFALRCMSVMTSSGPLINQQRPAKHLDDYR
jgi:hypothetical protein